uniref:Uncharacterized protein n=1 Tax=Athene cunicularia TaxID=194338 RepID=A0A663NAR5_ATHCN
GFLGYLTLAKTKQTRNIGYIFCIPQVLYKENLGRATPTPITPEMERVKRNQEHISSVLSGRSKGDMIDLICDHLFVHQVLYKEHLAKGTPTPMTPEMERAKRNQENISSVCSVQPVNENTLKSNISIPARMVTTQLLTLEV